MTAPDVDGLTSTSLAVVEAHDEDRRRPLADEVCGFAPPTNIKVNDAAMDPIANPRKAIDGMAAVWDSTALVTRSSRGGPTSEASLLDSLSSRYDDFSVFVSR